MKRHLLSAIFALFAIVSFAQVPNNIHYQAVARDNTGAELTSTAVNVRFSIRQSTSTGTVVYQETHATTTNAYGLFFLDIGAGTVVTGTNLGAIAWDTDIYFLQVELDVTGTFEDMGTTQLVTVPYAFHSKTADNAINDLVDDADNDPLNETISAFNISGNDINITDPAGLHTTPLAAVAPTATGDVLTWNNASTQWEAQPAGGADADWSISAGSITNIVDNVGIGTATPTQRLTVSNGSILLRDLTDVVDAVILAAGSGAGASGSLQINQGGTQVISLSGATGASYFNTGGTFGFGTVTPASLVDVNGRLTAVDFTMTNGAAAGFLLQSNATGDATWIDPTTLPGDADWTIGAGNISNVTDLVGIGLVPTAQLDVQSGSTTGMTIRSTNTHATSGIAGYFNNTDAGNTSPALDVVVATASGDIARFANGAFQVDIGVDGSTGILIDQSGVGGGFLTFRQSTPGIDVDFGANGAGGLMGTATNHTMSLMANSTVGMTIETSGNVTIPNTLTIPTGATANYVLTSNGVGDASWQDPNTLVTGLTGSGTTNFIPVWTSATGLGDSQIQDDGANIGIATAPNTAVLLDIVSVEQTGIRHNFNFNGGGTKIGFRNNMNAGGASGGIVAGIQNDIFSSNSSTTYGIRNIIAADATNVDDAYGVFNQIQSTGGNTQYGTYNLINSAVPNDKYGTYNEIIIGAGTGNFYGTYTDLGGATTTGYKWGLYTSGENGNHMDAGLGIGNAAITPGALLHVDDGAPGGLNIWSRGGDVMLEEGHLLTAGTTPTISGGTITGNDISGTISIPAGGPTSETINFATAFGTAPNVIITPANQLAGRSEYYVANVTTFGFEVFIDVIIAGGNHDFYYIIVED